jgi:hypothetical protein
MRKGATKRELCASTVEAGTKVFVGGEVKIEGVRKGKAASRYLVVQTKSGIIRAKDPPESG